MSAAAMIPSLIPFAVVVAMRRAEARLHRQLTDARAFTAETSIALTLRRSIDRRRLHGLISGGAIRATASNLHSLDAEGWAQYMHRRRRRVTLALSIVLAVIGTGLAVFFLLRS